MFRNIARSLLAATLLVALAGCAGVASFAVNTATNLSTAGPSQFKTYAEATAAVDLAHITIDVTAVNAKALGLHKPVLLKLQALNEALHAAWLDLKAANDAGQSLTYAGVQAAWDAYNVYRVQQAIPEVPAGTPDPGAPTS